MTMMGVLSMSLVVHTDSATDSIFSLMTETALQEVRNDSTPMVRSASSPNDFGDRFKAYQVDPNNGSPGSPHYVYFDVSGQITADLARTAAGTTSTATPSTELGTNVAPPPGGGYPDPGVPLTAPAADLGAPTYYTCAITTQQATTSTGSFTTNMYLVKLTFTWPYPANVNQRVIYSSIVNLGH
ncbi:MAG: hypothetical protein WDO13_08145 [Verrucomicrobiota bacterium]